MSERPVLLVTGGSRGIGRAIVRGAVERGACVAFCARGGGAEAAETLAASDRAGGAGRCIAVRADVSHEDDVDAFFAAAVAAFGRVDAVINNAGISRDDVLLRLSVEDWDVVIASNLTGAFLVTRRALREFVPRGGGTIVSIGSLSANGAPSQASYAASKGGIAGLMRGVAAEYGVHGVRAYTAVVGYVETTLTEPIPDCGKRFLVDACPLRRSGSAHEVAAVALGLAFGTAGLANGEAVLASGGLVDIAL